MKKLTLALALVMVLSTLLVGTAMTASAAEPVTPEKQLFTIRKLCYNPGPWLEFGWDLAQGDYPTDPTTIDPAHISEFDDTDYMFVTWDVELNRSVLNIPVFTFEEKTAVAEIVLCAIRGERWHGPGIEVYALNEESGTWDKVELASSDIDTSAPYKPETTWASVGSYRLIFDEPVAAKTFMIYMSTPNRLLGTGEGDCFWANEYTYAMGAVGEVPEGGFVGYEKTPETEAPTEAPATEAAATTKDVTEAPATTAGTTESPATTPVTELAGEDGGIDTWVWIVVSIAAVAIIVVVVIVAKKKK